METDTKKKKKKNSVWSLWLTSVYWMYVRGISREREVDGKQEERVPRAWAWETTRRTIRRSSMLFGGAAMASDEKDHQDGYIKICQRSAIDAGTDDLVSSSAVWWLTRGLVWLIWKWQMGRLLRFGAAVVLGLLFSSPLAGAPPLLGGKCALKSTQGGMRV
ncbi:hypothetical protein BHE74_00032064 [Ensete ventricosum]|nr:hypothetical protein BHE74_00032064 [Ensete ventricosum]